MCYGGSTRETHTSKKKIYTNWAAQTEKNKYGNDT